jgi:hypothetical protein
LWRIRLKLTVTARLRERASIYSTPAAQALPDRHCLTEAVPVFLSRTASPFLETGRSNKWLQAKRSMGGGEE